MVRAIFSFSEGLRVTRVSRRACLRARSPEQVNEPLASAAVRRGPSVSVFVVRNWDSQPTYDCYGTDMTYFQIMDVLA